ncbi:hypothetical protein C0993_003477, partial [Termitomyces sp. T159_Od127]
LWSDLSPRSKAAVIAPLVEQDLRHQEQFWQDVARESEVDAQRRIARSLEALALEGLGVGEAAGAGEGSRQRPEEKEGARETTPNMTAGAAMGAASPAARKAPAGGADKIQVVSRGVLTIFLAQPQGLVVSAPMDYWPLPSRAEV